MGLLGDAMANRGRDRYELAAASELKTLTERLDNLRALAERTSGDRRLILERALDAVARHSQSHGSQVGGCPPRT